MSKYCYKCDKCGCNFEITASIKEKEEGKGEKFICPKCGSNEIKQEFSAINFTKNIFGSGKKDGCCCGEDSCCGGEKSEEGGKGCC